MRTEACPANACLLPPSSLAVFVIQQLALTIYHSSHLTQQNEGCPTFYQLLSFSFDGDQSNVPAASRACMHYQSCLWLFVVQEKCCRAERSKRKKVIKGKKHNFFSRCRGYIYTQEHKRILFLFCCCLHMHCCAGFVCMGMK